MATVRLAKYFAYTVPGNVGVTRHLYYIGNCSLVGTTGSTSKYYLLYVSVGAPLLILLPFEKYLLACCSAIAFRVTTMLWRGYEASKVDVFVKKTMT